MPQYISALVTSVLQKHFDLLGRIHGNTKHLPPNTHPEEDALRALSFIDNIATVHGLTLPGRMPHHRNSDIVLLPSDMSKSFVYQKYKEHQNAYCFSRIKFENLWHELRPCIVTNKPATDLCLTSKMIK